MILLQKRACSHAAALTNSSFSTLTSLFSSSYTYTVAWRPHALKTSVQANMANMTETAQGLSHLASVHVHEHKAGPRALCHAAICAGCRARVYKKAVFQLVCLCGQANSLASTSMRVRWMLCALSSTGKPSSKASPTEPRCWQGAGAHLELVRVACDEYVDIQFALQEPKGVHTSPGHHL